MELSVNVHAVIRCKYRPLSEYSAPHTHGFYQLVCVAVGQGWITVNDEQHMAREGDVFLLAPEVAHTVLLRGSICFG